MPIAGTAVYMTSYPRTDEDRPWEEILPVRKWLYQTPEQNPDQASNGASDSETSRPAADLRFRTHL